MTGRGIGSPGGKDTRDREARQALWDRMYRDGWCKDADPGACWLEGHRALLATAKDRSAVDLGCGRGIIAKWLRGRGFSVVACDISDVALATLREADAAIETRCFDMAGDWPDDLPIPGVVVASLSLHYFSVEDTVRIFDRIHALLPSGGLLLLRVNARREAEEKHGELIAGKLDEDFYLMKDGGTRRYFTPDTLRAFLNGFTILSLSEGNFAYRGREKHFVEAVLQKPEGNAK